MAEHAVTASIAAEAAFSGSARWPSPIAVAMAKARTSEAALLVSSTAHALHGALGVTEEYDLQIWTRRLHEWRIAHRGEMYWYGIVGHLVLRSDAAMVDFVGSV